MAWAAANRRSSSMRAMEPSALITSQITAAGRKPASRTRSIEPSVWPARTSTPPCTARSGNTCPGDTRSAGPASGAVAAWMVRARSCAEMPVLTPAVASIDTVKAVERGARLCATIIGRPSRSTCDVSSDRQTSPRPWVTMKLTASAVANSAAITRSPSFSRSASSVISTMRPARSASSAAPIAGGIAFAGGPAFAGGIAFGGVMIRPSAAVPRTWPSRRPPRSPAIAAAGRPGWCAPRCAGSR